MAHSNFLRIFFEQLSDTESSTTARDKPSTSIGTFTIRQRCTGSMQRKNCQPKQQSIDVKEGIKKQVSKGGKMNWIKNSCFATNEMVMVLLME